MSAINAPLDTRGFTLIELLVVMAIMAILVALGLGSFLSSQVKSQDSQRKADLRNTAAALEAYYNDKGKYPDDDGSGNIKGCFPDDATVCPWGGDFWDKNQTIYMVKLPKEPASVKHYLYKAGAGNTSFQLYARLENTLDASVPKNLSGQVESYQGLYCGVKQCNYGVSSSNTTPEQGRTLVIE